MAMFRALITAVCIAGSGLIGFWLARMPGPMPDREEVVPVPADAAAVVSQTQVAPESLRTRAPLRGATAHKKRLEVLRAELIAQEKLLEEYQHRIHGTVLDWPADTPPAHRPEQVQSTLSNVLDACELPAHLSGFDCHEPPCLAVMRLDDPESFRNGYKRCPEWNEHIGSRYSMKNVLASCGDGRTETIAIFHMVWDDLNKSQGENLHKRISRRREIIESTWKCLPP
jgi:hypothetical protein